MGKTIILGALLTALAACSEPETSENVSDGVTIAEPNEIGNGFYAFEIPEGATKDELISYGKAQCEGLQFCNLMGWREPENMASAMPMLTRESEAMSFQFLVNRASDMERALYDCSIWPSEPAECLAEIE